MYDSAPDSIVARLVRRDAFVNSDDIAVYLDPYHDRRSGFFFSINAAGTLSDGVLYNDDWDDNTWDGVWEGRVTIDDKGWTAEMRIPYSQLRFQENEKQVWGVNFIREIARKNERDYIVYTPRNESGFVSRFVDLVGIEKIDPPRRLEILPYFSTKAEYTHHATGDPFNSGSRYSPSVGADMKFGIGGNLTVDATVNPDFGQVEVGRVALNKQKGSFYVNAAIGFIDPKFDANDMGFMFRTDIINGHVVLGYRWREPNTVTRQISLNVSTFRSYDFDKNLIWAGYWNSGYVQFLNYYSVEWYFAYNPETISDRRTRGGPLTLNPSGYEVGTFLYSDDRKDWIVSLGGNISNYSLGSDRSRSLSVGLEVKPAANISIKLSPSISWYRTAAQWVTSVNDPTATNTYGARYIFADLDQREVSSSIRLSWTFTPKLSLQMYVQPLISVGEYTASKELARPKSFDFATYGTRGSTIARQGDDYTVDPDGGGPAAPFSFSNPDFNFKSLRGSAVLRWEYIPGSTMYLVWTQQRIDESYPGEFKFGRDVRHLLQSQPDNIFLIKLSYWANP